MEEIEKVINEEKKTRNENMQKEMKKLEKR